MDSALSVDALYQAANKQRAATKDYFLEFKSTGAVEQSMRVRWITRITPDNGTWIYQISVLHAAPARVDAKQFFLKRLTPTSLMSFARNSFQAKP